MPIQKFKCKVCGKMFVQINSLHLATHNMTRGEYIKKYGSEGVQTSCFTRGNFRVGIDKRDEIDLYTINLTAAKGQK